MKKLFSFLAIGCLMMTNAHAQSIDYENLPIYTGSDLGVTYSPEQTAFKMWSPLAKGVRLQIIEDMMGETRYRKFDMQLDAETGAWSYMINEDLNMAYYTFSVDMGEGFMHETPGIYAKAVMTNGGRGYIMDLNSVNPDGWEEDVKPPLNSFNEIVLYELHVRDITSHTSSGSSKPTKFLGLVENGTTNPNGGATGIDHMKEMGITHVHILPSFDFKSVSENYQLSPEFNWGYDPLNYNVPEGSYATQPTSAPSRIRDFKEMVKGFHDNGIRVVMDVVYNHTADGKNSNFDLEFPGYYYRYRLDGTFSDASGCGNETASERFMMRKYMIESVKYWATEYHVDGFRFDLMAIHDIETMNLIAYELHKIDPTIFIYGEGWTAGGSPLPVEEQALKKNAKQLQGVAVFSDDIRDGIKGSVFEESSKGFVGGDSGHEQDIMFGIVGGVDHPQVDMSKVHYSDQAWSPSPAQTISYVSCHDNNTLFDKLVIANPNATADEIKRMHKLSLAIILTSQGVPFLHAGSEMMRTKYGEHNSYNLPDSINQINWNWKTEHADVVNYTKGLIALRKAVPEFRLSSAVEIQERISFIVNQPGVIAYTINGDKQNVMVIFNATKEDVNVDVPKGGLTVYDIENQTWVDGIKAKKGSISVSQQSAMILLY